MRPISSGALGGGLVGLLLAILLQQLGLLDLGPPWTGPFTLALFVAVGAVLFAGFGLWAERRAAPNDPARVGPVSGPGSPAEGAATAGSRPEASAPAGEPPPP